MYVVLCCVDVVLVNVSYSQLNNSLDQKILRLAIGINGIKNKRAG